MAYTRFRQVALLLTCTLAITLAALTAIPGLGRAQEGTQDETPAPASREDLLAIGEEVYGGTCIACHQAGGTGAESAVAYTHYPPLAGNPFVTVDDPDVVVRTVLFGRGGMPSFRGLSDQEIAGVVTYIRQSWGNDASAVSPELVAEVRAEVNIPPQEEATPFPTEPLSEGTPIIQGTPPGVEQPEAPRDAETPVPVPTLGQ